MQDKNAGVRVTLASRQYCTGCGACASVCPSGCIQMKEDLEGFLHPKIDTRVCIKCHRCERVCPVLCQEKKIQDKTKALVVINKDDSIRAESSSGGVFYSLAVWTITQGGVVFGARFNDQWEVVHDFTETIEGVFPLMKSKYVQSSLGTTLKKAKSYLDNGRWVLFSGTSCQLAALRSYLGKSYERLIQVDLICHGVPSPRVWKDYLNELTDENEHLVDIVFREKVNGWHQQSIRYVFSSADLTNYSIVLPIDQDKYLYGFANNLFLRRVCYQCPFKTVHRNTDITLADAWGVEKFAPDMDDDKGTSLVLIHSSKGSYVFNELISSYNTKEVSISDALSSNRRAVSSVNTTRLRQVFFLLNRVLSVSTSVWLTKQIKKAKSMVLVR